MGNKSSSELWQDYFKVQEKEWLTYGDEVTEKVAKMRG